MAYIYGNPPTKKAAKQLLLDGKEVRVFQPGIGEVPLNGTIAVEGPHFPKPHKWYGTATIENGRVVKID